MPLSAAILRAQNSRSHSPQAHPDSGAGPSQPVPPDEPVSGEAGRPQPSAQPNAATTEVGLWLLTHDIPAAMSEFHLSNYYRLAIGDVLEIGSGTEQAEVIVILRFGSIHLVSETQDPHP